MKHFDIDNNHPLMKLIDSTCGYIEEEHLANDFDESTPEVYFYVAVGVLTKMMLITCKPHGYENFIEAVVNTLRENYKFAKEQEKK